MNLTFGTGGIRATMGPGPDHLNLETIQEATLGVAAYAKEQSENPSAAIAYDSRNHSEEFAREAARVLALKGVKAYIYPKLSPTPTLSFAVRHLKCTVGICVTASHNPREYNGYKVYWEDGAQITPPHDKNILAEVAKVTSFDMVKTMPAGEAKAAGLFREIGQEIDDAYMEELKKQSIHPEVIREMAKDFTIVYTPLHGTGNLPVRRVLRELGFEKVYVVAEQEKPDGNFPTVAYPNPESPAAFELALKLAKEVEADIVLATDPDADRLGVYCKDTESGEYISFTGNMSGMLIAEYILRERTATGTMPERPALVETIVTTDMAKAVAAAYGVKLIEVLTGFKYIGQQILGFEQNHSGTYLFGFEESYGCLIGTHARDKDAIVATMALCEAAAYYRTQGKTLWDAMIDMYDKYGYYKDSIQSITMKGIEGLEKIQAILDTLRNNPPVKVGDYEVLKARDYEADTIKDLATGEVSPTGLPKSNVLYYDLTDDAWLCVRPSGTEPKVKFYYGIKGTSLEDADAKSEALGKAVLEMIDNML